MSRKLRGKELGNKIRHMYAQGSTVKEIMDRLSIADVTVYRHLKNTPRHPNKKSRIYDAYVSGIYYAEAAEQLGISVNYVRSTYSKFKTGRF